MLADISKAKKMREIVKKELEDVPKGNAPQNELRMFYAPMRLHSLGRKAENVKTKEEVFKECVEKIREYYPNFVPECRGDLLKTDLCGCSSLQSNRKTYKEVNKE